MSEIPSDWSWSTLGSECTKPQYGYTTSGATEGTVRLLRTTDITKGSINWGTVPFCAEPPKNLQQYLLQPGDVLISRAGSVGYSHVVRTVPEAAVFASYLIRMRSEGRILDDFLGYFLQSPGYWGHVEEQSSGITLANINAKKLQSIPLPVPPLDEQRRIVEILDDHFSRLDASAMALTTSQKRCAALEHSLLHRVYRSAADVVDPSNGWLNLGEISEDGLFTDGDWVESKDQDPSGVIRLTQLADVGVGKFLDRSHRFLRKDQADRLGVTYLQPNDLLIARMPDPLGRAAMVPEGIGLAITVVDVSILRIVRSDVFPEYVMWMLNSPAVRSEMMSVSSGTTRLRISRKNLQQIRIPMPPVPVQTAMVTEVADQRLSVDRFAGETHDGLSRIQAIRRSLLHAAFTGQLTKEFRND